MNAQPREDDRLDGWLKRVLDDNLPADVEAGMRGRIARFRAETMKGEARVERKARPRWRIAWASLSVLMLVSGGLLQGLQARSPLAERILSVMTEFSESPTTGPPAAAPEIRVIRPERQPVPIPENKEKDHE